MYIYIYYLRPHCVGCAHNDVDIYTDDLTSKAHNDKNNVNIMTSTVMMIIIMMIIIINYT